MSARRFLSHWFISMGCLLAFGLPAMANDTPYGLAGYIATPAELGLQWEPDRFAV